MARARSIASFALLFLLALLPLPAHASGRSHPERFQIETFRRVVHELVARGGEWKDRVSAIFAALGPETDPNGAPKPPPDIGSLGPETDPNGLPKP